MVKWLVLPFYIAVLGLWAQPNLAQPRHVWTTLAPQHYRFTAHLYDPPESEHTEGEHDVTFGTTVQEAVVTGALVDSVHSVDAYISVEPPAHAKHRGGGNGSPGYLIQRHPNLTTTGQQIALALRQHSLSHKPLHWLPLRL